MLIIGTSGCTTTKHPTPFFSDYKVEHTEPEPPTEIKWPEAFLIGCQKVDNKRECHVNPDNPDNYPEQWIAFKESSKLSEAQINANRAVKLSKTQKKRIEYLIEENKHLVRMGELVERRESLYVEEVERIEKRMLIDRITFGLLSIIGIGIAK